MNRVLTIGLVSLGLLIGYVAREPRVNAQGRSFPYSVGDAVRIEYADGQTRAVCVVEQFYGSYVSCKLTSRTFVPPDAPPTIVYNLDTAISVSLLKKAE
jgi:hypothetical protein